jgi:hypothetical protein
MRCPAINLMKKEKDINCEMVNKIKVICKNSEGSYKKNIEGSTQVNTAMNSFSFQVNRKDRSCSPTLKGRIRNSKGVMFSFIGWRCVSLKLVITM